MESDGTAVRSGRFFAAFLAIAAVIVLFVLLTVNRRSSDEVQHDLLAQRAHWSVTFWQTHGYFDSGGIIALPAVTAGRSIGSAPFYFYRSSTGARCVPALIVEDAARLLEGGYDWLLLARLNLLVPALSAALLALLGCRIALRLGLAPLHAFCLGAAVLAVHFTFPDALSVFWEMSGQALALPFFIAFLLLEDGWMAGFRLRRIVQALIVFGMVYSSMITAVFFLASYLAVCLVLRRGTLAWREWLAGIAAPAAAAMLLFALQLLFVHARHPEVPIVGSSFMARSGLDGDMTWYRDHTDILFGRDRPRSVFPQSRAPLFRWPALFIAGIVSFVGLMIAFVRRRIHRRGHAGGLVCPLRRRLQPGDGHSPVLLRFPALHEHRPRRFRLPSRRCRVAHRQPRPLRAPDALHRRLVHDGPIARLRTAVPAVSRGCGMRVAGCGSPSPQPATCYNSSIDFGQSTLRRRERERSASNRPPVWQRAQ